MKKNSMAKTLSQNYGYANNSIGELINVATAQRNEDYFCPICGESMTPHMGKVRRWHFVHKNTGNCSYESYLHKLAKLKIKQAFLSSEHFMLSYKAKAICSFDCPFITSPKCEGEKPVEFDLRKFYDTCEIEATYHQYRADLLLTSSTNPKLPPVLIEIMVTHKCTEDKISDGVRIIEIPIQSEKHIDDIVSDCKLVATRSNQFNYGSSNERRITLYNFNKVESFDPTESFDEYEDCFSRKNTIVFWLNNQGQFRSFDCHC
ncbi:MAG: competence protein CoiA family protein, partial [Bacteroidales bacterium]|nr:competence protein CoiA family protein [Bacteroidales bacterium]